MSIDPWLSYDPETGMFHRNGRPAGCRLSCGYIQIRVKGTKRYAHCLAWFFMTGVWPEHQIDHINGRRDDNRWANLRASTNAMNSQNRRAAHRNNDTGMLGVTPHGRGFQARIMVDGKAIHLGTFESASKAQAIYIDAKRRLHGACTI